MSYPFSDLGQRPHVRAELDELGDPRPLIPARVPAQHSGRWLVAAPDLCALIPRPATPGEPDRLRDRSLDSDIADRAAREAFADWIGDRPPGGAPRLVPAGGKLRGEAAGSPVTGDRVAIDAAGDWVAVDDAGDWVAVDDAGDWVAVDDAGDWVAVDDNRANTATGRAERRLALTAASDVPAATASHHVGSNRRE